MRGFVALRTYGLRDRHLGAESLLPAATVVTYSIGFFLSEISLANSIEKVNIEPSYWTGIALMSLSAALLIILNTYLRLSVAQSLGIVALRAVEPAVRHHWLFGVDVWWNYGLVELLRGHGRGASIDDFFYPSKGSQVFLANFGNLFGIDTVTLMRFAYIPFAIASSVLLFLISLRLFRSLRLASASLLILGVGEAFYLSALPQTYGITLLLGTAYLVVLFHDGGRLKWLIAAAFSSSVLLYVHHLSWLILLATYILSAIALLNANAPRRDVAAIVFLACCALTSVPPLFLYDSAFRVYLSSVAGEFLGRLIPSVTFLAVIAGFAAAILLWPIILRANRRISELQIRPSRIVVVSLTAALAFFIVLGSGIVLVPAAKTFPEFLADNLFNIAFAGISLSGIVFLMRSKGVKNTSGKIFLVSWLAAVASLFFSSLYMPLLDPARYPPFAYFPMAACGAYALYSLHQSNEKAFAACMLIFLAIQPLLYAPPIHTTFRPGMTYEWFPQRTIRTASWLNASASGETVGADIRLSGLIYGYSEGQVKASFSYAGPVNLTFLDDPAIEYGLSLGYFGFHEPVSARTLSTLNSSLYRRVYDNGASWVFSPTVSGASFLGLGNSSLVQVGPREIGPVPSYIATTKQPSLPLTVVLGVASGVLLGLAIIPFLSRRTLRRRASERSQDCQLHREASNAESTTQRRR